MRAEPVFVAADWQAPAGVRALTTTRRGGYSSGPWRGFNLALHVGDDEENVQRNRALLQDCLQLPAAPHWLQQVHGTAVVDADCDGRVPEADAAYTDRPGVVCAVLTADCLPVVIADSAGSEVAVAHCGWRGLAAGVLDATLGRFRAPARELQVWLGPAIGPAAFEVGAEVRTAFLEAPFARHDMHAVLSAFVAQPGGKYHADLHALARAALAAHGVRQVCGGSRCTFAEREEFYSYRRDGATGRMATLVWMET